MIGRKMLRDVKDYRFQFISVFLMAFIGVSVFTGMYVETNSFETTIEGYYEETNLADGWIYSNYLVDEFVHHVYLLGATTQMERQLVVDSHAQLETVPKLSCILLKTIQYPNSILLKVLGWILMMLTEYGWIKALPMQGIWRWGI